MSRSVNLENAAGLGVGINPHWRTQPIVTAGDSPTAGPVGGRRISLVFPTLPDVASTVSFEVNGEQVDAVYTSSLEDIAAVVRALTGVQAAYAVASATYPLDEVLFPSSQSDDVTGDAMEIVFSPGVASVVVLTEDGYPDGTCLVDTSEGVSCLTALWAVLALDVLGTQALLDVSTELRFTATDAFPGTAGGAAIKVAYVTSGASTPLSVVVTYDAGGFWLVTVNLATNGGGIAISTAAQVMAAVKASGAAMALVEVTYQDAAVPSTVQGAQAAAFLAGDADGNYTGTLWVMQDSDEADGSGNYWFVSSPAVLPGLGAGVGRIAFPPLPVGDLSRLYIQAQSISGGSCTVRWGLCQGVNL